MNRIDLSDSLIEMWKESRTAAGKSQEYMARALGVSKKTIQNWEEGTSSPNIIMCFQWFDALGQQPLPYLLSLLCPESIGSLNNASSDADIDKALHEMVSLLPPDYKKKLLFMLTGKHGSSVHGIIEMFTAHLHAPLRERVNVALSIATNYKICQVHKTDAAPEQIQPDLELLEQSIFNALDAVYSNKESYTNVKE